MAKQLLDVKLKIDLKKFYQDLETESAKYVYHCDKVILAKVHEQFDSKGGIPQLKYYLEALAEDHKVLSNDFQQFFLEDCQN